MHSLGVSLDVEQGYRMMRVLANHLETGITVSKYQRVSIAHRSFFSVAPGVSRLRYFSIQSSAYQHKCIFVSRSCNNIYRFVHPCISRSDTFRRF